MSKVRFTLNILAVMVFTLMVASVAQAQASRTWVSGVGDDVNPCSRTAPCKTFAGAISKTAANGYINAIDSGGFGALTITKSITVDGNGVQAGMLAAGTNGVNVNDGATATPNTIIVVLRNLSIEGFNQGLIGINFVAGKSVSVENCVIKGFKSGTGVGIRASLTGGTQPLLFIRDTIISDNLSDGVSVTTTTGSLRVICDNVRSDKNGGAGFHAINNVALTLINCRASSNTTHGVHIETTVSAHLNHCVMQSNTQNGLQSSGTTHFADCMIFGNFANGVNVAGGTTFTYGDNLIRNNVNNILGTLNTTNPKQ